MSAPPAPPPRTPWRADFPEVIVLSSEAARDAHPGYRPAKTGDFSKAVGLVADLLGFEALRTVQGLAARHQARLQPVTADEEHGFNAIPDAMALFLEQGATWPERHVHIVQSNKVSHTRSKSLQRIVTPASFAGDVEQGRAYLLVDDHAGLGGTLANLKGFIETSGGHVVGAVVLSASPGSHVLAVRQETIDMLYAEYGPGIGPFWLERFGHDVDCLTEREGRAVLASRGGSLAALADRLAEASEEARARGVRALGG